MSVKMNAASAAAILAALAVIPAVSAHGHVKSITANGETVAGTTPEWIYNESNTPGWYAKNQDNASLSPTLSARPTSSATRKLLLARPLSRSTLVAT